jgi:hypothetical protein
MRKISMLLVAAGLVCFAPALASAQLCSPGECMVKPAVRNNMGTMSAMMADIHQMLQSGKLNQAQQKHLLEMMNQMSGVMQGMSNPGGPEKEAQLQQELQQLQKKLQDLKVQISKK